MFVKRAIFISIRGAEFAFSFDARQAVTFMAALAAVIGIIIQIKGIIFAVRCMILVGQFVALGFIAVCASRTFIAASSAVQAVVIGIDFFSVAV